MRKLLLLSCLGLAGCATWTTWFGETKYDRVSEADAEYEFLHSAIDPTPGSRLAINARVDASLLNAVRVTPLEPGSAAIDLLLDERTVVERDGVRISSEELLPGDVVRVSFKESPDPLPSAQRIEVLRVSPN